MSMLKVSSVSKRFGGLQAVDNVSFEVERGEVLGLIGPNGSGKSTTLSLLMGVVRADSGTVELNDRDISRWRTHSIAKQGMSMVFQHSRPLHRQSVLENIKLALLPDTVFRLVAPKGVDRRARQVAERVGLDDVLDSHPDELPFASLRRLEVAKALAQDPTVMLLDEPFAGLAPTETREFSELVESFRDEGRAVVLVDHNVKAVAGLVDRIVAMHAGQKIASGTPSEVTVDPKVREVYFGSSLDEHQTAGQAVELGDAAGDGAEPLLDVDIQSVTYGRAEALRSTRIHVNPGEFVSVVGINGAGKTTLFKAILGFVPYAGDVRWTGRSLRGLRPGTIASQGIALCPETRELFGSMTVRENLELGGHNLRTPDLHRHINEIYELFPALRERHRQPAATLSGGEQQMLTIGRALMQRPKLLIVDEPTLGLAPLVVEKISEAIDTLQKEMGLSVLLGEQNLTFALQHSHRVYFLETGDIRWQGDAGRFVDEVGEDVL